MSSDSPPAGSRRAGAAPAVLEVDLAALARTICSLDELPLSDMEATMLARSLEGSGSDEELLANTLGMLRLVLDRLGPPQA